MNAVAQPAVAPAAPLDLSFAMEPPISVRGVDKRYDGQTVLAGANLQLEPGAVLGLIGRNGAGTSAAALDPVARRELLREIAQRAGESGTSVLFSTHIVSDLERAASHVAFMHEGRVVLQTELDTLKERHLRLRVPASAADQLVGRVPGEVARRALPDGALSLVVVRDEGVAWPALVTAPGVHADVLSLEDLFVEVAE